MTAQVITSPTSDDELNDERGSVTKPIRILKFVVKSATGGAVSHTTTYRHSGTVAGVAIVSDTGGTAPTTGYNVYIKDEAGCDLLAGAGVTVPGSPPVESECASGTYFRKSFHSKLTITCSGMGDEKGTTVYFKFR